MDLILKEWSFHYKIVDLFCENGSSKPTNPPGYGPAMPQHSNHHFKAGILCLSIGSSNSAPGTSASVSCTTCWLDPTSIWLVTFRIQWLCSCIFALYKMQLSHKRCVHLISILHHTCSKCLNNIITFTKVNVLIYTV